ncbi:MAG: AAA family ATPase [bacterium]|nr:AAA family ATPase [bacterium]
MKYLYLDSFRGFSDTLIPIKNVNFLVGENSTGKTSVLDILFLLSSPKFWTTWSFNDDCIEFGDYWDILSANKSDQKTFSIGIMENDSDRKKGVSFDRTILLTYNQEEGTPTLYRYSQVSNDKIIILYANYNGQHSFSIDKFDKNTQDNYSPLEIFHLLYEKQNTMLSVAKELPPEYPFGRDMFPIIFILDLIAREKKPKLPKLKQLSFKIPFLVPNLVWFAPIRTKPRRTYDRPIVPYSPEGEHTPYLLKKTISNPKTATNFTKALEKFGKESGLFKKVSVHEFSSEVNSPFELRVTLSDKPLRINSVGYGVSQGLPIIAELISREKNSWFAIQQPEVHLHPRAQAALGDLLYSLTVNENKNFIIETHSDFTIDRFRTNFRAGNHIAPDSQVLFFERSNGGNLVTSIPILSNGEYSQVQPKSFREFFLHEQFKILGL